MYCCRRWQCMGGHTAGSGPRTQRGSGQSRASLSPSRNSDRCLVRQPRPLETAARGRPRSLSSLPRRLVRNIAPVEVAAAHALEKVCVTRAVLSDATCNEVQFPIAALAQASTACLGSSDIVRSPCADNHVGTLCISQFRKILPPHLYLGIDTTSVVKYTAH